MQVGLSIKVDCAQIAQNLFLAVVETVNDQDRLVIFAGMGNLSETRDELPLLVKDFLRLGRVAYNKFQRLLVEVKPFEQVDAGVFGIAGSMLVGQAGDKLSSVFLDNTVDCTKDNIRGRIVAHSMTKKCSKSRL